ncbi:hypothetical protein [Pararhodonellum marinum]|uniref:hypothetical protein n=1 Tax=Pararhodonellum marinum TaxID=2755358 RepID=UPI001890A53D|nr:hypothetical protein [Pararhodonellum marinum]
MRLIKSKKNLLYLPFLVIFVCFVNAQQIHSLDALSDEGFSFKSMKNVSIFSEEAQADFAVMLETDPNGDPKSIMLYQPDFKEVFQLHQSFENQEEALAYFKGLKNKKESQLEAYAPGVAPNQIYTLVTNEGKLAKVLILSTEITSQVLPNKVLYTQPLITFKADLID